MIFAIKVFFYWTSDFVVIVYFRKESRSSCLYYHYHIKSPEGRRQRCHQSFLSNAGLCPLSALLPDVCHFLRIQTELPSLSAPDTVELLRFAEFHHTEWLEINKTHFMTSIYTVPMWMKLETTRGKNKKNPQFCILLW